MGTEKWQERSDMIWWIVGFVDGEGTFSASLIRNKTSKYGWQVFPEFVVTQGAKSLKALLSVKEFFGCGNIYINRRKDNHKEDLYRFCIRSRQDIVESVVPFFTKYPLKTSKRDDFNKFSSIISILTRNKSLNEQILKEIALILSSMNRKKIPMYLKSSEAIRQNADPR